MCGRPVCGAASGPAGYNKLGVLMLTVISMQQIDTVFLWNKPARSQICLSNQTQMHSDLGVESFFIPHSQASNYFQSFIFDTGIWKEHEILTGLVYSYVFQEIVHRISAEQQWLTSLHSKFVYYDGCTPESITLLCMYIFMKLLALS